MKIFSRFYVRRLYRTNKLEEIIKILTPWMDEVLYLDSPFLRQVASYHLRPVGGSYAPRFFKKVLGNEILRLNEPSDLRASILLSIVESFSSYNPGKGNVSLVDWLSWRVPYELSKLVTWRVTHPVSPFDEAYVPPILEEFDRVVETNRQIGILSEDLGLDRQSKHYYLRKVTEK